MTRNYLEAVIVIIIAAAFGFFLTYPKYNNLQDVVREKGAKQQEIKTRQEYYFNLERTAASLEQYQDNLKKVETALPDGADAPAVMNFIQAAAIQSGLILKEIDYSKSEKTAAGTVPAAGAAAKKTLRVYEIAATTNGTYPNLKIFLSRIELSSRMIEVGEIDFGKDVRKSEEEKNMVAVRKGEEPSFDFKIKLYAKYY